MRQTWTTTDGKTFESADDAKRHEEQQFDRWLSRQPLLVNAIKLLRSDDHDAHEGTTRGLFVDALREYHANPNRAITSSPSIPGVIDDAVMVEQLRVWASAIAAGNTDGIANGMHDVANDIEEKAGGDLSPPASDPDRSDWPEVSFTFVDHAGEMTQCGEGYDLLDLIQDYVLGTLRSDYPAGAIFFRSAQLDATPYEKRCHSAETQRIGRTWDPF